MFLNLIYLGITSRSTINPCVSPSNNGHATDNNIIPIPNTLPSSIPTGRTSIQV